MLPINPVRNPREHTRERRAKKVLALLARIKDADMPDAKMRWSAWQEVHHKIILDLDVPGLQRFQSNPKIAPHICFGGGETYLNRLRDRFGYGLLSFFLSTYRETLCGDPQDLTSVEGNYITRSAMRHLYHLAVLHQFCRNYYGTPIDFVEIGGGFGNLARLATQFSLARRYYIVDYAASICVQYYYVTEFFDEESVAVWTGKEYLTGDANSKICLVTPDAVPALSRVLTYPSVLASTMAMTEIPLAGQRYYFSNLDADAVYIFGQTLTVQGPQGKHLSVLRAEELHNQELFHYLASRCHTVNFTRGGYFSEFLGLMQRASKQMT